MRSRKDERRKVTAHGGNHYTSGGHREGNNTLMGDLRIFPPLGCRQTSQEARDGATAVGWGEGKMYENAVNWKPIVHEVRGLILCVPGCAPEKRPLYEGEIVSRCLEDDHGYEDRGDDWSPVLESQSNVATAPERRNIQRSSRFRTVRTSTPVPTQLAHNNDHRVMGKVHMSE